MMLDAVRDVTAAADCDTKTISLRWMWYVPTFRTYLLPTRTTVITWAHVPSARCMLSIYTKDQWPPGRLTADGCHHCTVYGAHLTHRADRRLSVHWCHLNGWQYLEPNLRCLGPGRLMHPPSYSMNVQCRTLFTEQLLYLSVASVHTRTNNVLSDMQIFRVTSGIALMNTVRNKQKPTIVGPCIVTDSLWIKPTDALNSNFVGVTVHVSDSLSVHHQGFLAVHQSYDRKIHCCQTDKRYTSV
jgi:hypothetical protein